MDQIHFLNIEYFFNLIVELFRGLGNPDAPIGFTINHTLTVIKNSILIGVPLLIVLLILLWAYYQMRILELRRYEKEKIFEKIRQAQQRHEHDQGNERWEHIESLFQSDSQADWRMAIIEADSMLDELLISMGFPGDSIGERLKSIDSPSQFPNLEDAWEAHKIRNKIAHEGIQYKLTERDKNRVHAMYKRIFHKAGMI